MTPDQHPDISNANGRRSNEELAVAEERKNPFWFLVAGCVILLAACGSLYASLKMMGVV